MENLRIYKSSPVIFKVFILIQLVFYFSCLCLTAYAIKYSIHKENSERQIRFSNSRIYKGKLHSH